MQQYEAVSQLNSERYARLERAQVLVNQFWETYEELSPWIEETQALISQLPPPAIDHEQLKQQQEDMRVRRCWVRWCSRGQSGRFPHILCPVLSFLGILRGCLSAAKWKSHCHTDGSPGSLAASGSLAQWWQGEQHCAFRVDRCKEKFLSHPLRGGGGSVAPAGAVLVCMMAVLGRGELHMLTDAGSGRRWCARTARCSPCSLFRRVK